MAPTPRLAYVQARIQARYAERPRPATWANLDQIRDFGRYVQQANAAGFGRSLEKIGLDSSPHAVEVSLREAYRQHVGEVAKWMPSGWRQATLWFALLIDMEQIRRITEAKPLPAWMNDDPFLRRLADRPGAWPLSKLVVRDGDGRGLSAGWRNVWRNSWPRLTKRDRWALGEVAAGLPVASFDGALIDRLERMFRRNPGRPTAVFSYLGLVLMDLLKLRGEMLRRLEFPGTQV